MRQICKLESHGKNPSSTGFYTLFTIGEYKGNLWLSIQGNRPSCRSQDLQSGLQGTFVENIRSLCLSQLTYLFHQERQPRCFSQLVFKHLPTVRSVNALH